MSRHALNIILLTGLVVSSSVLTVSAASADPMESVSTTFQVTCRAEPNKLADPRSNGRPATVRVSAPAVVDPGEVFHIDVDPGSVQIPNDASVARLQKISRVKIDLPIPANAEFISAAVTDPGNAGAEKAPSIIRVDELGNPSPNGSILRLSGANEVVGNGPDASRNAHGGLAVNAEGGSETNIVFPKFRMTVKAANSGVIETKIRTSGDAAVFGSPQSFLTFLPELKAGWGWFSTTVWAPTFCSPRNGESDPLNDGAKALSSTLIEAKYP